METVWVFSTANSCYEKKENFWRKGEKKINGGEISVASERTKVNFFRDKSFPCAIEKERERENRTEREGEILVRGSHNNISRKTAKKEQKRRTMPGCSSSPSKVGTKDLFSSKSELVKPLLLFSKVISDFCAQEERKKGTYFSLCPYLFFALSVENLGGK